MVLDNFILQLDEEEHLLKLVIYNLKQMLFLDFIFYKEILLKLFYKHLKYFEEQLKIFIDFCRNLSHLK